MDKEKKEREKKYNVQTHSTDMQTEFVNEAKKVFCDLYDKSVNEKEMAAYMVKNFDKKFPGLPGWHCIVGKNFSSYVTHEEGYFLQMQKGPLHVLLFKCI